MQTRVIQTSFSLFQNPKPCLYQTPIPSPFAAKKATHKGKLLKQTVGATQMANSAARMLLKNGKSFPQLLRSRPVGRPSNINVCNKDQLLSQSLINPPTQQQQLLYTQRPVLGDGFNFVDFVLGKDREFYWKSSAAVEARGERRQRSDTDEDDDDHEDYESDEVVDFDDDPDWDDQYDDDTNDSDDYDRRP